MGNQSVAGVDVDGEPIKAGIMDRPLLYMRYISSIGIVNGVLSNKQANRPNRHTLRQTSEAGWSKLEID